MSFDIEQATRIVKSGIVSIELVYVYNLFFLIVFFIQIWKTAEPYIQKYLDWYYEQHDGEPLPQKCCH
jgi:hypothetical protein